MPSACRFDPGIGRSGRVGGSCLEIFRGEFGRGLGGADYWRKGITGKHGHGDQGLLPVVLTWALVAPGRDYRAGMSCRDGVTRNVTKVWTLPAVHCGPNGPWPVGRGLGTRTTDACHLPRSFGRVANALCLEALRGHWPRRVAAAVGLCPIALVVPVLPPSRAATSVSLGRAIQDASLLPKPGRGAADAFCLSL